MSKFENDDFLAKFANRVEKVGRDGVMGLMKSTGVPINIDRQNNYNNQNYFDSYKRRNYTNEIHKNIIEENNSAFAPRNKNNIYVNQRQNKFPTKNYDIRNIKHYSFVGDNNTGIFSTKSSMPSMNDNDFNNINHSQRNSLLRSMNKPINTNNVYNPNENNDNFISRSYVRKNSMNYRYNNQNNLFDPKTNFSIARRNIYTVANNRQNIVDHGYTPYTLKDYKKITNDVKLGKLGPNIGTEEWVQKRNRMKKMSEYGNKVIYEGKGCKNKVSESADDRHRRLQEYKALNGKWNIINEYSKGLLLNKDKNSNEQFKRNANDKLLEEERLIDKQFELDMRENEEEERMLQQQNNILYQQRLNRMKNLLFK
jgi:hypothetical protein